MAENSDRKSSVKESEKSQSYNPGESSRHHIISRTVGGPSVPKNIYHCSIKWHRAWHQLFKNYLPSVVIRTIRKWTDENGNLDKEKMGDNTEKAEENFRAWKIIFGKKSPQEAIDFIEREFLPVEEKFLKGELGNEKDIV